MYAPWFRLLLAGVLVLGVWLGGPAPLQAAPRYVQAELISEVQTVQPGTPFAVGVQLRIAPGWHVYWQNPGDSGDRVRIQWELPPGTTAGDVQWPYPQRLPVGPLMNFGYRDQVLLLSQIRPSAALTPGQTLTLQAQVSWLVCREDCIPEATTLTLRLPVAATAQANPAATAAFAQVRRQHPQPAPWPVRYAVQGERLTLSWPLTGVKQAAFFPWTDGVITYAAPQVLTRTGNLTHLTVTRGYQEQLTTVEGVLVVTTEQGTHAYTMQAVPGVFPAGGGNLGRIVGLGFLGGLLLNVMPCVLPILSLKTLQLADKVRQSPRQVRLGGLSYGAGVLVSLWVVAAVLLGLRGLGQQLGWGFQLQSPGMVLVLLNLLFAVGLNLSGVFQVGTGWLGVGQSLTERPGYVGEFFTGVLATVAATPCTAPFMATAIGAALTLPPGEALAVFTSLGLGFACPYTLLCFVPGWRRWLPRPGAWMHTLQRLLAFPVYGAAAWLLWVLTLQTGTDGLAVGLTSLVLVGLAAWLYGQGQVHPGWRRFSLWGALLLAGFCLTLPGWLPAGVTVERPPAQSPADVVWEPFTPERLQALRQQGRPVFVNFTAAWCVSCQMNERLVFRHPEVQQAFRERGITLLKADWTRQDPAITQILQGFGRSGVPLYVLYPGGNRPPVVWPSRLRPNQVTEWLSSQTGG